MCANVTRRSFSPQTLLYHILAPLTRCVRQRKAVDVFVGLLGILSAAVVSAVTSLCGRAEAAMRVLRGSGSLQEGAGLDPAGAMDPSSGQPAERQRGRLGPGRPAALLLPSAAATER